MQVLTINLPVTVTSALPYGSAVLNGVLKQHGYKVKAWDLNIAVHKKFNHKPQWSALREALSIRGYTQGSVDKKFALQVLSWIRQQIKFEINATKPDIIAISVFSSQSLDAVIPVVEYARKFSPNSYIILGGRGLDNAHREHKCSYGQWYADNLPVDCVYLGDAENHIASVVKQKVRGLYVAQPVTKEELLSVPPAEWHGLNFSDYDGFDSQDLRIPVTASKGCVRDCTFCDVASSWPRYVFRDGISVAEDMVNTYHTTGVGKFEFTDSLVNGSITNFRNMNRRISELLPNQLDYIGYAICRPKREMPESDFDLAKAAGATLFKVGIESGSEQVRFDMKKKFSNEDIDWFATQCYRVGIHQRWLMFTGYPTETEQDFEQTLALLEQYKHMAQQGMISVFLSLPMMLTSGSAFMQKYAVDYGLDHNQHDMWGDFFWTSSKYTDNTFEVRLDRWQRFMDSIVTNGYHTSFRQPEKLTEIAGLQKIYNQYNKNAKKIIPIIDSTLTVDKSGYI